MKRNNKPLPAGCSGTNQSDISVEQLQNQSPAKRAHPSAPHLIHALPKQAILRLITLVLVVLAAAFVITGATNALSPTGSHDFQWTPANDLLKGINPYAGFLQWEAAGNEFTPPHFLHQSPSYPASVYVMLAPLAALEWPTAKLVWLVINLCLIALLLLGLQRQFPIRNSTLLLFVGLAFLCSTPLRASLGAGQHNFLSLAAFIWSYHYATRPGEANARLSGLLLALAWVKYSLTFPLTLLFVCRGKWKPVVIASIIHFILTVIAALQLKMWPHEFFFSSIDVVLMGDGSGFLNLVAIAMKLNLPVAIAIAVILFATGSLLWLLPRVKAADDLLLMAFLGLFSCAVFYHHSYDFVVLLLGAWALARQAIEGRTAIAFATLISLAWCGQWMVHEVATHSDGALLVATQITDSLLVVVFYCTLALVWGSLYISQANSTTLAQKHTLSF